MTVDQAFLAGMVFGAVLHSMVLPLVSLIVVAHRGHDRR